MKERKEIVSKNLVENVVSTLGTNSKKPNTVVMAINEDFIIDALGLFRDKKKGVERETGLVRLELVAVYAEEIGISTNNVNAPDYVIGGGHACGDYYPETTGTVETPEQKIEAMNQELDEVLEEKEGEE